MATSKSTKFEIRGVNHLALVCSDMERTVQFYTEVLGLPLVKTLEIPGGGQHFFFDVSEGSGLAFFWFPDAPPAAPGIAGSGWSSIDPATGNRIPVSNMSAIGSMHHVAFDIPLEKQEEYKERLRAAGVPVTEVNHHILYGKDGRQASHPSQIPNDAEAIDEFVNSIYFPDPDGIVLEFAAWTRPLTPDDVKHTPARAIVEVPARPVARRKAASAGG
jgi:catechol 2,3-dioxygenase-like lactoylglutathione lyase family enzyme